MSKVDLTFIVLIVLSLSSVSVANAETQGAPKPGSKALERMKKLVGTWEGTSSMEEGEKVTVQYHLTSADSTLVETLFPGTPHEMVSVYYDSGGALSMTHYCALKNQPRMRLSNADSDSIRFAFTGGTNLNPESDAHIHGMDLSFVNENQITQEWIMYQGGKQKGVNTIKLSRIH